MIKKIKTKLNKWRVGIENAYRRHCIMRETKMFAKLMPTDPVYDKAREEDNHVINCPPVPADLGKILEIKSAEVRSGRFWYASKKQDISGTTDYEIRNDQQCQEAFKKLRTEQMNNPNGKHFGI